MIQWDAKKCAAACEENPSAQQLVDVRENDEWALNRIEGAVHIPLSEFAERGPAELESSDRLILYCHHGMRSAQAQAFLMAQGFTDVINLAGGIDAWSREVDPGVPRY